MMRCPQTVFICSSKSPRATFCPHSLGHGICTVSGRSPKPPSLEIRGGDAKMLTHLKFWTVAFLLVL
eukprot:scaffold1938_cov399-Prasinococcus_capsulatus_cf.AAC.14